jgi:hypothetical protein
METNKLEEFCFKILDKFFQAVGFKKFSLEYIQKTPNWKYQNSWTKNQEEYYFQWFVESAQKDLNLTKHKAEIEYYKFIKEFGWPIIND